MANVVKHHQKVPREVGYVLRTLKVANRDHFEKYCRSLVNVGWTYEAIGTASEFTGSRVRQLVLSGQDTTDNYPVPAPGQRAASPFPTASKAKAKAKKPSKPTPSPEVLARMLTLKPLAEKVRFTQTQFRLEAEEYTRLMKEEIDRGVPAHRLAKALGVAQSTVTNRLARYGYRDGSTLMTKHRVGVAR